MDKTNLIGYFAIIVIIVSLASFGFRLTGKAAQDTAVVNVTVETAASINFSDDFIDFGSGAVNGTFARLESNDTASVDGNWSYSADYFTLENVGNVNVSLDLQSGKNASEFIGGSSPDYEFSLTDGESGSCNTSLTFGGWYDINTTNSTICTPLDYVNSRNLLNISVRLVIPSDSLTGSLTDSFTATATAV